MTERKESMYGYFPEHDLMTFGGAPAVYHCHHFNLFLDQTIDDALGPEEGARLRRSAAHEFGYDLISNAVANKGTNTPVGTLYLAQQLFAGMGHGSLQISADSNGGSASGHHLHYGYTWFEKYGQKVKRHQPADAFAAGFSAAAVEVAFGLTKGSMMSRESDCVAKRDSGCVFELWREQDLAFGRSVGRTEYGASLRPTFTGEHEGDIAAIAQGLRDFVEGVSGDERGLVQAFGVFVTLNLAGYYNRISYDALAHVARRAPHSVGVLTDLLRESGHVCVFNTCGGILLSPEWEAMVGPLSGDPLQIVVGCLAIIRALGMGHWTITEFVPNQRLVFRTPSTYESAYFLARHGPSQGPNEYFVQGSALAIAQLTHRAPQAASTWVTTTSE